jgi:hypothetical protein
MSPARVMGSFLPTLRTSSMPMPASPATPAVAIVQVGTDIGAGAIDVRTPIALGLEGIDLPQLTDLVRRRRSGYKPAPQSTWLRRV